jgi:hypothetical protein
VRPDEPKHAAFRLDHGAREHTGKGGVDGRTVAGYGLNGLLQLGDTRVRDCFATLVDLANDLLLIGDHIGPVAFNLQQ